MEQDGSASKMSQNYLKQMEEKIFHVKVDKQPNEVIASANLEIPDQIAEETIQVETCSSASQVGEEPNRKKSLCIVYSSSDGYSAKQFPKELLKQLSQHERFEIQHMKCDGMEVPQVEIVNLASPQILVKETSVQTHDTIKNNHVTETGEQRIKDAIKGLSSKRTQKKPALLKKPKNHDVFNPHYDNEKSIPSFASIGKTLLESIRTKVFGFRQVNGHDNDEEWRGDYPSCHNLIARFPKETRHAMSNLSVKEQGLCKSCSRQVRNIRTIDAQTSPISSATHLKPGRNTQVIPCPLNLLCDRGIHIGKCEPVVRYKTQRPVCGPDCICRQIGFHTKLEKHPGKAVTANNLQTSMLEVQASDEEKGREALAETESDVSLALEAKTSMDTILQLMEPQKIVDEEEYPEEELPVNSCLGEEICAAIVEQNKSTSTPKMNGINGHTNGDMNGCGDIITQNQQKGCWTIGLINSKYRYLTAETFGFKINANGASLKKKQIWTLEPESANNGESMIFLRSHLDKYLAVDSFGNVTCESEEKEPGCQFQISVSEDGSGRWALKNVVRGYFLGSTSDKLTCTAKVPGDAEFWHTHLAARPQVNLRSVGRKRFAHLSENLDEIHVDANIPWGEDTLFTLEFRLDESGKYAIHTCNNKYLSMGGKLVDTCNKDCLFSAEYHSGQLALRDRTGAYLSPIGSKAVLKTRSNTVTKDELFSLEDSLPQASFVASLNSRFVSVKQGVDVTANQDEISDHETFQLEFDWSTKRWYIRTMQDRYWTLETGGGIQASGDKRSSNALFDLVWQADGSLAFRANNGRYVITKRSGHLYATADTIEDNCKYFFYLINRPILVLKCEQGFVGFKSASSPKLECNKASYECIQVERGEKGIVYFKGQNGKYWHVDTEGVTADSDTQEGFYLELREPTRLCIKSLNGNYLTASKNGLFRLGDTNIENATQWEY